MGQGSRIKSVTARQVFSLRGYPGIEAKVETEDGSYGAAIVNAGASVGEYEVQFVHDGGKRWGGLGVSKAISNVSNIIAPTLIGVDATKQRELDEIMIALDGTPNKSRLGGNATASVSAAALKAGAASLDIPLYQHIGGVNACTMPTPGVLTIVGSVRYGGGKRSGGKPGYSFFCYGFDTYSEASYACWEVKRALIKLLLQKHNLDFGAIPFAHLLIPGGVVEHDSQLCDLMLKAIKESGNEGKVGIQVDVAAGTYYDKEKGVFVGLFSREDKTQRDMIDLYKEMAKKYPFVIIEDPLDEADYEGHALLTRELGIEVVGDDLFTTNMERLKRGIEVGACNAVLLKVNQIGTITEAFDVVQYAYRHGYGVMPCSSRGEGPDIADYAVGLGTGHLREGGDGPTANRMLEIEAELGDQAQFLGRAGFKP